VTDLTSPSYYTASVEISALLSVVSTIPEVLTEIDYVTYYSPSLSCYESEIESLDYYYPNYVQSIFAVFQSPSIITSSFSYYASLEAEYSTVAYAISAIVSAEVTFPSLSYYEYSFLLAASQDSSIVTQAYYIESSFSSISAAISSISS